MCGSNKVKKVLNLLTVILNLKKSIYNQVIELNQNKYNKQSKLSEK